MKAPAVEAVTVCKIPEYVALNMLLIAAAFAVSLLAAREMVAVAVEGTVLDARVKLTDVAERTNIV